MKNKWVMKIKWNGVYEANLVVCGYSQVLGVNFSKNHSPVVNDIMFCILLQMIIFFGFSAKIVDVKNAFSYRDLDEEIHMECLEGMSDGNKDDCIIFNKCLYGIVQSARQHYKKAAEILKKL